MKKRLQVQAVGCFPAGVIRLSVVDGRVSDRADDAPASLRRLDSAPDVWIHDAIIL
ncbi:hypothetical protein [Paraburkholderia sp. BR14320]|uniref:hypothetical protein n=1 Tax=unclassified Paraburkholderia TaxID=2615204 RepID=UPI0034CE45B5